MCWAYLIIQLWQRLREREVLQRILWWRIHKPRGELRIRRDGATEKGKQKEGTKDVKSWDKIDSSGIRAPLCKEKRFYPEILTDSGFYWVTPGEFRSYLMETTSRYISFSSFKFVTLHILKELSTKDYSPRWQWNTVWPVEQTDMRTRSLSGVKLENFHSFLCTQLLHCYSSDYIQRNRAGV